jgi:predicted MPP superfamily phosphohydrolase
MKLRLPLSLLLIVSLFSNCAKHSIEPNLALYDEKIALGLIDSLQQFNILHFSDVHYDSNNSDVNMEEMLLFANKKRIKEEISAIISTGDVSNGSAGKSKESTIHEINSFMERAITSPKPLLNVIGNHDDNINYIGTVTKENSLANALSKVEQYNLLVKPLVDKWPEIKGQENRGYHYTDFAKFKIRMIALDAYDYPLAGNAKGVIKYWVSGHYFSQEELDWFYDTLKATPDDYGLIVMSHAPFTTGYTVGNYIQGVDVIPSIINAYKHGTSYTHVHKNKAFPELSTSKVFDFSNDQPREFICYLGGHIHNLQFLRADKFPDQVSINMSNMWTNPDGKMFRSNEQERNTFAFTSVDRKKRKITVVVYGAHQNKTGLATDRVTVLDY